MVAIYLIPFSYLFFPTCLCPLQKSSQRREHKGLATQRPTRHVFSGWRGGLYQYNFLVGKEAISSAWPPWESYFQVQHLGICSDCSWKESNLRLQRNLLNKFLRSLLCRWPWTCSSNRTTQRGPNARGGFRKKKWQSRCPSGKTHQA